MPGPAFDTGLVGALTLSVLPSLDGSRVISTVGFVVGSSDEGANVLLAEGVDSPDSTTL